MAEECTNRGTMPNDATLNIWLNNEEQTWGGIKSLRVVDGKNLACFEFPIPAIRTLKALRMIGDSPPPTPANSAHIGNGVASIMGVSVKFSLFRKS